MFSVRYFPSLSILAVMIFSVGCGTSTAPAMGEYIEVSGTVTLADGSPMKTGTIHFEPEGTEGREGFSKVNNGAFTTKLFAAKYKVAFDVDAPRTAVPAKFTKFPTANKTAEVKSDMTPLQFQLK